MDYILENLFFLFYNQNLPRTLRNFFTYFQSLSKIGKKLGSFPILLENSIAIVWSPQFSPLDL